MNTNSSPSVDATLMAQNPGLGPTQATGEANAAVPAGHLPRRRFLSAAATLAGVGLAASAGHAAAAKGNMIDLGVFSKKRIGGERLPADKTALIIVDMMNRFCDPQWMGKGTTDGAKKVAAELATIIPNIKSVLEGFRRSNGLVVHVVNAKWTRDGREVVRYQRGRDYELFDTPAMSIIEELRPQPGEIVIRKVASSAFTGTGLDYMLKNAGIENVVLCGQYGTACVFYTMIQSREFGFNNYWLEDGMLYSGTDTHKQVFETIIGSLWAKLVSTPEAVRALA